MSDLPPNTTTSPHIQFQLGTPAGTQTMAVISAAGDVRIDWEIVELVARENKHPNQAYARAFLAIRAGTWKPLSPP